MFLYILFLRFNLALCCFPPQSSVFSSVFLPLLSGFSHSFQAVGEKFNLLDLDKDGSLSTDELKQAIVKLFKRNYSETEAGQLVDEMDANKDGKSKLFAVFLCNY
jgi:Ca2+-binding EF-hand superfamily protein